MRRATLICLIIVTAGCFSDSDANNKGWKFGEDAGDDVGHSDAGHSDVGTDSGHDAGGVDMSRDMGGPAPQPVTFRMVNEGSAPVFVYHGVSGGAFCGGGEWLVVNEGGEPRRIASDCTRCSCDAEQCEVCALDCAPGVDGESAQLGPREHREFTWDGLLRVDDAERQCETLRLPEGPLSATFCWATGFEETFEPFGDLTDISCETVDFDADDEVVEFAIDVPAPEPVQFTLTNTSSETIYAPLGLQDPCGGGSWINLYDAETSDSVRFFDGCGVCSCVDVGDSTRCPEVCPAVACPAPTSETYALAPGEQRLYAWDRVLHPIREVNGESCDVARLATGLLDAEVCYGLGFDDSAWSVTDVECQRVTFDALSATDVAFDAP